MSEHTAPPQAVPSAAPSQPDASASEGTGTNGTGPTLTHATSTSSLPMFIASSDVGQEVEQNLDLDDLFRDCYFGDFPMSNGTVEGTHPGAVTVTSTPAVAPAPPPPRPLVPNTNFAAPTATLTAPSAAIPATTTSAAVSVPASVPASVAASSTSTSTKRKVDDLLGAPKPAPVPSSAVSSITALKKDPNAPVSTKALTDQQKVERRERNRKHAKRSRLRKKFLLESLQEQISGLQCEIDSLKDIIRRECPERAEALFESISGPKGKFTPLPMPSGFGPVKTLMEPDFRLMSALSGSQQNFAISDPSLPDNPIVYVSQGFLDLTGYTLDQVLGRNCRFLQGPGTDQSAVDIIRKGVREGLDTSVCLLNYKADGTPFWNQFFVAALRDAENNVVNFVGVQCEVSKAVVEKQLKEKAEADSKVNADGAK